MADTLDIFPPVETELLVCTCSPQGTPLYRNRAWTAVFLETQDLWAALGEDDREMAITFSEESAKGGLVTNKLFMVAVPNRDEPLPLLLNFLPVFMPDEEGNSRVMAITITGEVLVEPTSWTHSQTQHHRMETLGRMTMGIAHDFNNLLSSILGHIEYLRSSLSQGASIHSFEDNLRTIEQASMDGAALVKKIQHYIRQEKQTEFEPIDLPNLVRDCFALTRPYWYNEPRRQGIDITFVPDLQVVPAISGSASELRDVMVNLILNAVQAMPEGGTLKVRTYHKPDEGVLLQLSDTGTGMSEGIRSRIFEPLFTTKGERGTGMGLAVSYGIIQEHNANIAVDSVLGEGTTFTLTFPAVAEQPVTSEPVKETTEGRKAHLMIVDDDPNVRNILKKLLSLKGHVIQEASSGPEALAIIENKSFDLVFTDHGMPEMSGRQLATILRKRYPDLPIVLLSGDTEVGQADHTVNVVLAKPFKLDILQATIQSLLSVFPTRVSG